MISFFISRFLRTVSCISRRAGIANKNTRKKTTDVLPNIYAFHRYTGNSTCLSGTPAPQSQPHNTVKPHPFTADLKHSLRALYAQ